MKRLKINTTFEENEEELRQFFAALSHSERLQYFFKLRGMFNFNRKEYPKGKFFKIHRQESIW